MIEAGKYNILRAERETESGFYMDGENLGEILLPGAYMPANLGVGDTLEVFVYYDSEDRLVATTEDAFCEVGDFVMLEVLEVNEIGAFLNWGLKKDLLVPFKEQKVKMTPRSWHIVYVYIDEKSNRIAASAKIDKFLSNDVPEYKPGEEVELFICQSTPMGFKAIINGKHWGMLYESEVFQPLSKGEYIKGYINKVREDGKIDLRLYRDGVKKSEITQSLILEYLKQKDGFISITDKSPSEDIYETFGISKKNFKMSIGILYKERKISLEENGIRLIE